MSDVIIIGAGPAGISAALYTIRSGLETTVITTGDSALAKAEKIENYYGFAEPISGKELLTRGIDGAEIMRTADSPSSPRTTKSTGARRYFWRPAADGSHRA